MGLRITDQRFFVGWPLSYPKVFRLVRSVRLDVLPIFPCDFGKGKALPFHNIPHIVFWIPRCFGQKFLEAILGVPSLCRSVFPLLYLFLLVENVEGSLLFVQREIHLGFVTPQNALNIGVGGRIVFLFKVFCCIPIGFGSSFVLPVDVGSRTHLALLFQNSFPVWTIGQLLCLDEFSHLVSSSVIGLIHSNNIRSPFPASMQIGLSSPFYQKHFFPINTSRGRCWFDSIAWCQWHFGVFGSVVFACLNVHSLRPIGQIFGFSVLCFYRHGHDDWTLLLGNSRHLVAFLCVLPDEGICPCHFGKLGSLGRVDGRRCKGPCFRCIRRRIPFQLHCGPGFPCQNLFHDIRIQKNLPRIPQRRHSARGWRLERNVSELQPRFGGKGTYIGHGGT
mmetsp:Transcript_9576/g.23862  ORF Transcript_9576/g.23862 Transcript_9576/m.23862 type:complete len:390 (-) Transcript_9576:56-1225(-)